MTALLGQGGMGAVYRAEDGAGRAYAVKVLLGRSTDEQSAQRFRREAQAAGLVKHENVLELVRFGEEAGFSYLVLELATGGSVRDLVRTRGRLDARTAARIGAQIARGLGAIHAAGLVHRDLKPENVLLDGRGVAKISDLGLVRGDASSALAPGVLTKTGELLGTPEFMAPEQAEAARTVDSRADLYALGATLFALLTGEPPFRGTGYALVKRLLVDPPPSPRALVPEVPEALDGLVLALLAKDPSARPQTADAVARSLEAIERSARGGSPVRRIRRAVVAGAALTLLLAALAGAGAIALRARPNASAAPSPPPAPTAPPPPRLDAPRHPAAPGKRPPDSKRLHCDAVWGGSGRRMGSIGYALAVSPDGRRVLGGGGEVAFVWDLETGEELASIRIPGGSLHEAAFSPSGETVVLGSNEGVLVCIDVARREWYEVAVRGKAAGRPAFLDERRVIATAEEESRWIVRIIDILSGESRVVDGLEALGAAPVPGTHKVVATCPDGWVRLLDPASVASAEKLYEHEGAAPVAVSPDGRYVASGRCVDKEDNDAVLYDTRTREPRHLARFRARIFGVAIADDGALLVAHEGWRARLVLPDGKSRFLQARTSPYCATAFTRDGKAALFTGECRSVEVFDRDLELARRPFDGKHDGGICSIAISKDGSRIVSAGGTSVVVRDGEGKEIASFVHCPEPGKNPRRGIDALALSPDGRRVLVGGASVADDDARYAGRSVALYETGTGRELARCNEAASLTALAFRSEGEAIIAFDEERRSAIKVWDFKSKQTRPIGRASPLVRALFHYDGQTIVARANGMLQALPDDGTPNIPLVLDRPAPIRSAASFSSSLYLLGGENGALIFDTFGATAASHPLDGPPGPVEAAAFSPDGKLALTAHESDGTVRLWDVETRMLLDTVDLRATTFDRGTALVFEPGGDAFLVGTARGVVLRFTVKR